MSKRFNLPRGMRDRGKDEWSFFLELQQEWHAISSRYGFLPVALSPVDLKKRSLGRITHPAREFTSLTIKNSDLWP